MHTCRATLILLLFHAYYTYLQHAVTQETLFYKCIMHAPAATIPCHTCSSCVLMLPCIHYNYVHINIENADVAYTCQYPADVTLYTLYVHINIENADVAYLSVSCCSYWMPSSKGSFMHTLHGHRPKLKTKLMHFLVHALSH